MNNTMFARTDVDARYPELRAIAAMRGEQWGAELGEASKQGWIPFPQDSVLVRKIATNRIADLTHDTELQARLTEEFLAHAARRWDEAKPQAALPIRR